ncbi:MAG: HD-GYP domain-containing protein [Arcobacter sp.]|uniref:HD-GYP domain-containing protein n=1 Tax=Arcobacter sp. TaxID=1872629 RepID=UPI003D0B0677
MDKKKQMAFNLNNFLLSMSAILDYKQFDLEGTALNHFKRVTYIALNLGAKFNLEPKMMADLCSLSLIYNLEKKELEKIPFLNTKEFLEDSLIKEIIEFSSKLDKMFNLGNNQIENRFKAIEFAKENKENFSKDLIDNFLTVSSQISFWLDLQYENEILMYIYSSLHDFTTVLDFEEILNLTTIFHKLENKNSIIIQRASKIADEFNFEHKDKQIFLIATSLQNIGKMLIPNSILNKKEKLSFEEFEILKSYPYHTKRILGSIMGFNDILSLSIKVQERLDGSGYIYSLDGKNLSLKDRLLACLVIYNSLREDRVYRNSYNHLGAIELMKKESKSEKIDGSLVEIFERIFE